MKKIIAIVALIMAFGMNASAQEKTKQVQQEVSQKEKTYNDIQEISKLIKIPQSLQDDFMTLLLMRTDAVANAKSQEDKKNIFNKLTLKMTSALTDEQLTTLQANKEIYSKLFLFESK